MLRRRLASLALAASLGCFSGCLCWPGPCCPRAAPCCPSGPCGAAASPAPVFAESGGVPASPCCQERGPIDLGLSNGAPPVTEGPFLFTPNGPPGVAPPVVENGRLPLAPPPRPYSPPSAYVP